MAKWTIRRAEHGDADALSACMDAAYAPYAATASLLMVLTIVWSAWDTRSVIPYLPGPPPTERVNLRGVVRRMLVDTLAALRSGSFRWLFGGVLIVFVMVGVDAALNIYMYTYFWELSYAEILVLAPAYPVGVLLGAPLAPLALLIGLLFRESIDGSMRVPPVSVLSRAT